MALTLSKNFSASDKVEQTYTIESWHVSQSVDALTGASAYDITISGSLDISNSVNTGDLIGTASWASNAVTASYANTADTATNATKITVLSNYTTNQEFNVIYASTSSATYEQLYKDDGSTMTYNPSTDTLTVDNLVGTASYASTATTFEEYVTGSYNGTTIYPQGTIYTKFENAYASQSSVSEYDLLSAATAYTGDRTLPAAYVQANTIGEAKILKFNIKGKILGNSIGGANGDIDCYVKIGSTIINGTQLGSIAISQVDDVPFEIDYELIFSGNQVYGCGSLGWCKNADFKRQALADLYTPTPTTAVAGLLQFIVSGSSDINITGSAAYVEFIN